MAITLKDIAKAAGVSTSTVSRTINDHYSISEKTKEHVRKVMEDMGYYTKQKLSIKSLGVVIPSHQLDIYENPFYLESIRGIGSICNQMRYRLHLIVGANDDEMEVSMNISKDDGFIFLYSNIGDHLIHMMYSENIPFLIVGKPTEKILQTLYVDNDNVQAGFEATNYLIGAGHRKIGYIETHHKRVFSIDRKLGYLKALNINGIPHRQEYIQRISRRTEFDLTNLRNLLQSDDCPTAFVVCDDMHTMELEQEIRFLHKRIPEDISLISFNNSAVSRMAYPSLTSIDINANQLGVEAASQLIKHLENPYLYPTKIIVPFSLIERKSVKKIPHSNY